MAQTAEEKRRTQSLLLRINEFAEYQKISLSKLGKKMGLTAGALSRKVSFNGNEALNTTCLQNLLLKYPELNPTWVLTGKGTMIWSKQEQASIKELEEKVYVLECKVEAYLEIFTHIKKKRNELGESYWYSWQEVGKGAS